MAIGNKESKIHRKYISLFHEDGWCFVKDPQFLDDNILMPAVGITVTAQKNSSFSIADSAFLAALSSKGNYLCRVRLFGSIVRKDARVYAQNIQVLRSPKQAAEIIDLALLRKDMINDCKISKKGTSGFWGFVGDVAAGVFWLAVADKIEEDTLRDIEQMCKVKLGLAKQTEMLLPIDL